MLTLVEVPRDAATGRLVFGFIFRDAQAAIPIGTDSGTDLPDACNSVLVAVWGWGEDMGTRTERESDRRLKGELISFTLQLMLLPAAESERKSSTSQGSDIALGLCSERRDG